ncbi:MAG: thioredoxin family protein [Candidatus Dadabacteria bacterium]|nr:thioredoxin family protein [Candidatus Dadabacteria bacterium]
MTFNPNLIALAGFILLLLSHSAYGEAEERGDKTRPAPNTTASAGDSYNYELTGTQKGHGNVEVISRGTLIDLLEYVEPGKYTAFLFYADWCGPCKILKPRLEDFAENGDKLALREIDIINWENPLVRYYDLPSIPYFIIYGPDGEFAERGPGISNEIMKEISSPD